MGQDGERSGGMGDEEEGRRREEIAGSAAGPSDCVNQEGT